MTPQSDPAASGIGARLKGGRERAGLSLVQAAERLHVDPDVIAALEAERFGELGAAVFVRGHLRRYAELVHEPAEELLERYASSVQGPAVPDLTRVPRGDAMARASGLRTPGLILVVTVALIGTAWWISGSVRQDVRPRALAEAPPIRASEGGPAHPSPASTPPAAPAAAASEPQQLPVSTTASRAAPAAVRTVERTGAGAKPLPAGADTAVTFTFTDDSWAEVYDAHGTRLLYELASAHSVRSVAGAAPLRVVLGYARAVLMQINGRSVPVPSAAHRVEFEIDRGGGITPRNLEAARRSMP